MGEKEFQAMLKLNGMTILEKGKNELWKSDLIEDSFHSHLRRKDHSGDAIGARASASLELTSVELSHIHQTTDLTN